MKALHRSSLALAFGLGSSAPLLHAQEPLLLELDGERLASFAADVDGDGSDEWIAAVRRVDAAGRLQRVLRVFRFEHTDAGERSQAHDTLLPDDACAIACADALALPGRELLIFDGQGLRLHPLTPSREPAQAELRWHPQGRTLLEAASFFADADPTALLVWPYLRERERALDLLVPLAFGYARLRGTSATGLRVARRWDLAAAIGARRVWDGALFTAERELPLPTLADLDGDGEDELVVEGAGDGALWLCTQEAPPERWPLDLGASGAGNGALRKSFRRLVDLDGDARADLLSWVVRGDAEKGFAFETELEIRRNLGGLPPRFAEPSRLRFRGAGTVAALPDLDGDGRADLVLVRCENPAAAIVGGLATLRTAIYLAREDGAYPSQPELELASRLPLSALREEELRAGILPSALRFDRDLDGDGTHDLLELDPRRGIRVLRGALERREHDGRSWTTYRLLEPAWFAWEGNASFETEVLVRDGKALALVVPQEREARRLALPRP
ncbi:MAG: VCBS repeat-containing protein [Planctomycetes bacterium]|nr:VCBS repeat-containing protein [Planctomycetota bacterium]